MSRKTCFDRASAKCFSAGTDLANGGVHDIEGFFRRVGRDIQVAFNKKRLAEEAKRKVNHNVIFVEFRAEEDIPLEDAPD